MSSGNEAQAEETVTLVFLGKDGKPDRVSLPENEFGKRKMLILHEHGGCLFSTSTGTVTVTDGSAIEYFFVAVKCCGTYVGNGEWIYKYAVDTRIIGLSPDDHSREIAAAVLRHVPIFSLVSAAFNAGYNVMRVKIEKFVDGNQCP